MQKTRFGLSVGLAGAILYFLGLFGGFFSVVLAAGYLLVTEDNIWLKRTAAKAIGTTILFAFISAVVGYFVSGLDGIKTLLLLAGIDNIGIITTVVSMVNGFILGSVNILKFVIFLILAIKAFGQRTMFVPLVDNFINKHMD